MDQKLSPLDELLSGKFDELIWFNAHHLKCKLPSWDNRSVESIFNDLFSFAYIVSVKFKPDKCVRFITYLCRSLHNEVIEETIKAYKNPIPLDMNTELIFKRSFLPAHSNNGCEFALQWEEVAIKLSEQSRKILHFILSSKKAQELLSKSRSAFPSKKLAELNGIERTDMLAFAEELKEVVCHCLDGYNENM